MNRLYNGIFVFALFSLLMLGGCNIIRAENSDRPGDIKTRNSIQLIGKDLAEGKINRDEAYLFKTYALFDSAKLPREYRSDVPVKDGTMLIRELRRAFDGLGVEAKNLMRPYLFPEGRKKRSK